MPVPLVLVHSPLVGPGTWDAVAGPIRHAGHQVLIPDLTGAVADGPPYWPRQVATITGAAAGRQVILVGHSGAGPLLAAAGTGLPGTEGYVFVDAGLPCPGQILLEQMPQELAEELRAMAERGWLPPWPQWLGADGLAGLIPDPQVRARFAAGCARLPMAMFEEALPAAPGWPDAPCGYLRLSEAYEGPARQAKELGWPVTELDSHHLAMLTDPAAVAGALLGLVGQLRGKDPPGTP